MNAADVARTPNPLLVRLGGLLEAAINRAMALDPDARERLMRLDGRRVGIELRPLNTALALTVEGDRLRVGPHWERTHDLNLRASPASLFAFALRRNEDSAMPPGKVDISGDAELARQVEKILRDFRPDVEAAFASVFGDIAGVPIARAFANAFAWARESAGSMALNAAEYVRDDTRDAISIPEAEQFFDDVDALRERADRLDARIKRLRENRT